MTVTLDPRLAPATDHQPTSRLRRILSIARAEATLLLRNRSALMTGLLLGPGMAGFLALVNVGNDIPLDASYTSYVICILLTWSVLMTVYYNLTTIFVTRREDRVFKRLSTGEATGWDAVIAAAVPATVIVVAQMVLGGIVAAVAFGVPVFTNPLFVLLGIVVAIVVSVALAAASSSFTTTVEAAQYSTMPVFLILGLASGAMFPLTGMPDVLQTIAAFTPLNAANELLMMGLNGTNMAGEATTGFLSSFGDSLLALESMVIWLLLSVVAARRAMRFEPRR